MSALNNGFLRHVFSPDGQLRRCRNTFWPDQQMHFADCRQHMSLRSTPRKNCIGR